MHSLYSFLLLTHWSSSTEHLQYYGIEVNAVLFFLMPHFLLLTFLKSAASHNWLFIVETFPDKLLSVVISNQCYRSVCKNWLVVSSLMIKRLTLCSGCLLFLLLSFPTSLQCPLWPQVLLTQWAATWRLREMLMSTPTSSRPKNVWRPNTGRGCLRWATH